MKKSNIAPLSISDVISAKDYPQIEKDIVLLESLRDFPSLTEARRMSLCLFLCICTSGIVTLTVNDKKRVVSSNTVMIVTDESVVDNVKFSDDFDGFGFFMSYKMLQDILKDVSNMSDLFLLSHNHPVFDVRDQDVRIARWYFDALKTRIDMPHHRYRREVVRLQILTMLYDLSSTFDEVLQGLKIEDKQSRGERIFVHFVQLVEHHFREKRQVQWYAQEMGLTPKYLSEVISSVSRRTPNQWIDKFVTTEMRNLLRHTDMKMAEIAEEMNFPSQSFFGKYFRENVGVSPTEYRNGVEK